ncbi:MAG: type II toxin-antitoxin system RelE/ParE family toxin [Nitrococcus sp.]|nr:type II toxin-antitoxin system RelE/ParE family toxin [Nitrococcus sp.]
MRVQYGRDPVEWKPMSTVGSGVREFRIRTGNGVFRVIYTTKIADVVHILHAFQKKSQKTDPRDMDLARQRFKALQRQL